MGRNEVHGSRSLLSHSMRGGHQIKAPFTQANEKRIKRLNFPFNFQPHFFRYCLGQIDFKPCELTSFRIVEWAKNPFRGNEKRSWLLEINAVSTYGERNYKKNCR